jgi:predicted ester cyclase
MLSLRSAFPDLHFDTQELIPTGDKVIVRWTATGTHQGELLGIAPSGMSVSIMGTSIYRLSGGQMVDEYTIWDSMGMMQQLGVIPYLA